MNNLSINEMKKIAYDVIDTEIKNNNLEVNVFPITFIEYYKSYLKHKNYSLSRKTFLSLLPLVSGGFHDKSSSDVVVFLDSINIIQKIDRKLSRLLEVCFHEIRHSEQKKFNPYSYNGFFESIDRSMRDATFGIDYYLEHDNYLSEIDANLCGVIKTKEYLRNKYPDYYEKNIEYINNLERKYRYNLLMYDPSHNIDRYLYLRKNIATLSSSVNIDIILPEMNKKSPVLEIFLNGDGSFKNVKDIINNEKYKLLDSKITYAFFSSHSFLNSISFESLNEEEKKVVGDALKYTYELYLEQEKYTEEALKFDLLSDSQILKNKKVIFEKLKFIKNNYLQKFNRFLNLSRSEKDRIEHMKEVYDYYKMLEKSFIENQEFDEHKEERKRILDNNEAQTRQEWKNNKSDYVAYLNYKNSIKDRLESEKQSESAKQLLVNDYEEKKQNYEGEIASKELVNSAISKSKEEINSLDDFILEERKIKNSRHFTDEQKKKMIEQLYSELDKYEEENPKLSRRKI